MRTRLMTKHTLTALLLTVLLAGCMPDLKSDLPPDRIYWLEVPEVGDTPAVDLWLDVVPGLDSDRVWLLQRDQRLNYYAGAYWPDNLRPLLSSLLSRSLAANSAGTDLSVLVERFFAVEVAEQVPPEVVVRAVFESAEQRCRFEWVQSAGGERLREVVAGHQRALDALAAALAEFVQTGRCP